MPTISIIMAVYNTELYLRQSIESVLSQSFGDWELIVIDDGSTDQSATICDEFAAKDERIIVIHKENTGQADSRNLAIKTARGKYIMFIDSDDWIKSNMLEEMMDCLNQEQADMVVGAYFEEYTNERIHIHNTSVGTFSKDEAIDIYYHYKNKTTYVIWGAIFKKELLKAPIPQLRYLEDTAIILQWVSEAKRVVIKDNPYYYYRMRKGSVMHVDKQKERAKINLEVISIRNKFAKQQQLLPVSIIDMNDAQAILYVALQFVRSCWASSSRKEIAQMASLLLKELTSADVSLMKRRIRNRLLQLKEHPIRFAWKMYINGLFSIHRYRNTKVPKNLFP